MNILYDSKNIVYKNPFGCLKQDEVCTITIKIPKHCNASTVAMILINESDTFKNKIMMALQSVEGDYEVYSCQFSISECDLYFYHFKIYTKDYSFKLYKRGYNETAINTGDEWQLTCYDKDYANHQDYKGKVMYQIFPDRFAKDGQEDLTYKLQPYHIHDNQYDVPEYRPDCEGVIQNNDFFGGNLKGIIQKLPYLKELNVSVIYLNPIFMAYSNHRYDTANYMKIDPLLGDEIDFKNLCNEAHKLDMKIILDGVFSHTGCNSIYFDKYAIFGGGAYHDQNSQFKNWFQFNPHNHNDYTSWWGIETLPCVNELNEDFVDYIIKNEDSVINHWMNLGADGYRLDVADELPDEFIKMLHQEVKSNKENSLVIGEVWEDASNKVSYSVRRRYFTDCELDSVMNYPYKDAVIGFTKGECDSEHIANTIITIAENYPKPVLDTLMNSLSTHDTMRILTVLGSSYYPQSRDERAYSSLNEGELADGIKKLKFATFLQFMLPGSACIYYGDEVGLQGFEDPFNRRFFPWDNINAEIFDFYKKITKIKVDEEALCQGNVKIVNSKNGVLIFERECKIQKEDKSLIVIASMNDNFTCFSSYDVLLMENAEAENGVIHLGKHGFVLLRKK